jgi:hypothetical protein
VLFRDVQQHWNRMRRQLGLRETGWWLASEDVLVAVATGNRPPQSLGLADVPANARIASFLSSPELLPKTAAMVTNGGYGGAQMALASGVPLSTRATMR